VKSPEDRDAFGNWAFDARATLDLSADWVANELGVSRPTIVKAEGKERSRRTERELPALYMRLARERGVILQPLPGAAPSVAPAASGDMQRQVSDLLTMVQGLITTLEAERREWREERKALWDRLDRILPPSGATPPGDAPEDAPDVFESSGLTEAGRLVAELAHDVMAAEAVRDPAASPRLSSVPRTPARRTKR
jgi:hypothetical protein